MKVERIRRREKGEKRGRVERKRQNGRDGVVEDGGERQRVVAEVKRR